jgi:hypothetical protein
MERVVGGIVGLLAFAATAAASLSTDASFGTSVWRACAALFVGYVIGRMLFGSLGLSTAKEAAGTVPPPAPPKAPGETPKKE